MERTGAQLSSEEMEASDEQPPFGQSWTPLYVVVLINLVVLIILFHLFTRAFS